MSKLRQYTNCHIITYIKTIFVVVFLSCTFLPAPAQDLIISTKTDKKEYLVGDYITLTLNATFDIKNTCQFPTFGDSLGTFEVISISPIDKKTIQSQVAQSQTIVLAAYDSAMMLIPSLVFTDKINKKQVSEPIPILIKTVPVDTLQPIREIAPIIEVSKDYTLYGIIGALLLLILSIVFWYYSRLKNKNRHPIETEVVSTVLPHLWAIEKLTLLDKQQLCREGKSKEHYIALSEIIREYIERRFEFNTLESTTDELLLEFKKKAKTYHKERAVLDEILHLSDFVKFAKVQPDEAENEQSMSKALAFINTTTQIETSNVDVKLPKKGAKKR